MIDLKNLEAYKENNRIEAKKALGGLPKSIWETYSAFANTLGGVILLGVEEYRDHTLHPVDLPDPARLIREFWTLVNDPKKVSINILSNHHVRAVEVAGNSIIVIAVPQAPRYNRPVYIDGNPLTGSYRRSGEGDYRCTPQEVQSMLRDAEVQTQDMRVLADMEMDALDLGSVRRYRNLMKQHRPGHMWEALEDSEFLHKLGAAGASEGEALHPTAAGLLMFGRGTEIVKEFPNYALTYQEQLLFPTPCTDLVTSDSKDWSGNVFDFYFRICNRITQNIQILSQPLGEAHASVCGALREALVNCLINADYYGCGGIVIRKQSDQITFSNPGNFRIQVETAKSGGVSDPRNTALIKMFRLLDIGQGTGSGIPGIFAVWREQKWELPRITEHFDPERVTLSLCFLPPAKTASGQRAAATGMKGPVIKHFRKTAIIEYLTKHICARNADIAAFLDLNPSTTRKYLSELVKDGIIAAHGNGKKRTYQLKR